MPKKLTGTGTHRGFGFVDFLTKQDAKVRPGFLPPSLSFLGHFAKEATRHLNRCGCPYPPPADVGFLFSPCNPANLYDVLGREDPGFCVGGRGSSGCRLLQVRQQAWETVWRVWRGAGGWCSVRRPPDSPVGTPGVTSIPTSSHWCRGLLFCARFRSGQAGAAVYKHGCRATWRELFFSKQGGLSGFGAWRTGVLSPHALSPTAERGRGYVTQGSFSCVCGRWAVAPSPWAPSVSPCHSPPAPTLACHPLRAQCSGGAAHTEGWHAPCL